MHKDYETNVIKQSLGVLVHLQCLTNFDEKL